MIIIICDTMASSAIWSRKLKVSNFTWLRLVKLQTLLMQLIPNCTATHGITYTNYFWPFHKLEQVWY